MDWESVVREFWLLQSDYRLEPGDKWKVLELLRRCTEARRVDAALVMLRCIETERVEAEDVWELREILLGGDWPD